MRRRGADFLQAVAFLTRLPAPLGRPRPLAHIAWAFPLVGLVVGVAGGAVLMAGFYLGLHPLLGGLLAVGAQVLLTGALHEDGLADAADGFGGGGDKADKLRIMRDSRLGSYGVLALIFSVAIRAAALASMAAPAAALALVAAAAVSRGLVVGVMWHMEAARGDGIAAGGGRPSGATTLVALGLAAVTALSLLGAAGLIVLAAAAIAAWVLAGLSKRQIGGVSGDVLGAVQQVAEAAVLLGAVGMARL